MAVKIALAGNPNCGKTTSMLVTGLVLQLRKKRESLSVTRM